MRRFLFTLCLSALPAVSAAQTAELAEAPPIDIGVILPLSGSGGNLGGYLRDGITLAHKQLPDEKRNRIRLHFEDDGWQVPRSVSAFKRLTDINKVQAVVAAGSAVGNALAPLAEQRGIPFIAVGASDQKVSAGRRFSFLHWVTPEVEADVMADEIARRGYQRLAVIGSEQEGALAVLVAAEAALKENGIGDRVVLRETYLIDTTDFRTYLTKARRADVDGIIVCLLPGSLAAFAKQTRQLGINADLIGVELFEDEHEVKAAEGALDGQWYVNADSASNDFEKSYRNEYGRQPGWAAANAYDALKLLAAALAEHPDAPEEYLAALEGYTGAAGSYSATGDNRFTLPAAVKVVTKEGFIEYSPRAESPAAEGESAAVEGSGGSPAGS